MISAVIEYEDNTVSVYSSPSVYTGKKFRKGFYEASTDSNGNVHIKKEYPNEVFSPYLTKDISLILDTVKAFFKSKIQKSVNLLGYTHKLGILLYGRQGCGKTSLINYIAHSLKENNQAIVFFCNTGNHLSSAIDVAKMIREVQEDPIIFIADEFERYAKDTESEMKNFLDGKDSIDNMLFLGATNYLDRIPDTLKSRPSRFKIVREIKGFSDKKVIKAILNDISSKIKPSLFTSSEIDKIVKESEDVTIDEIKHFCLDKLTNTYVSKDIKENIGFKISKHPVQESNEYEGLTIKLNYWGNDGE